MACRPLAMVLVHHPVVDRRDEVVTSAVTNLDIHDLARLAASYRLSRFYLVTPVREQQRLVGRIISHWREGFGAGYNPDRRLALSGVHVFASFAEALSDWQALAGSDVLPVLTGAKHRSGLGFRSARTLVKQHPLLLTFGTGHGLAPELYRNDWPKLNAVRIGGYNHLSVRAAAAIILDRLVGEKGMPKVL